MLQVGGNALMRQAFDGAGLPRGLSIKVSRSAGPCSVNGDLRAGMACKCG
jgi:hypothetical protein